MPPKKHNLAKMRLVPYEHDSKLLKQILRGIEDIKTSKTHDSWDSLTQPAEMKQLKELEAYHDKIMRMSSIPPRIKGKILSRLLLKKTKLEEELRAKAPTTHKTTKPMVERWSGDDTSDSTLVTRGPYAPEDHTVTRGENEESEESNDEDNDDEMKTPARTTTQFKSPTTADQTPLHASTPKRLEEIQSRKKTIKSLKENFERDLDDPNTPAKRGSKILADKYANELARLNQEEQEIVHELSTIGKRVARKNVTKKSKK